MDTLRMAVKPKSLKLLKIHCRSDRHLAEKTEGDKTGKLEGVDNLKMPGFVPPVRLREEGYFTQKAREELEKFKRKLEQDKSKPLSGEER